MPATPAVRLPAGPFDAARRAAGLTAREVERRAGFGDGALKQIRHRGGFTPEAADHWAVHGLKMHPGEVWDSWYDLPTLPDETAA